MTRPAQHESCDRGALVGAFAAAAAAHADAVALRCAGRTMTYRELAERSDRLAARLAAEGLRGGDLAAIYGEPSEQLIVGIFAILKCGAAYAPLSVEDPSARLQKILQACRPRLLLASGEPPTGADGQRVIRLDDPAACRSGPAPKHALTGASLAYVMFTSGSTGEPKGVMVAHASVLALALDPDFCRIRPGVRVLLASNLAFDGSVFEIFGALLNGATLVIADARQRRSVADICGYLRGGVDVAFLTTALFNRIVDLDPLAIAYPDHLLFGGQACSPDHVARAAALQKRDGVVAHVYGPTETTVFASFHPLPRLLRGKGPPPIGRALAQARLHVVDGAGAPCPPGVTGEILIGGAGVALGYLNDARLTAARFTPDPGNPGQRLFRTGDHGYWNDAGALVFVGRRDNLVKVRGYRIELEEVELALRRLPDVNEAAVRPVKGVDGEDELVAYVELGAAGVATTLAEQLGAQLPPAMVPRRFVAGRFRLNASGKTDLAGFVADAAPTAPPASAGAKELDGLRAIWCDLLGRTDVRDEDDFFSIGGHSLRAATLLARIADLYGVELELHDVFEHSVLADLAAQIAVASRPAADPAPVRADEERPLTAAQAEIWPLAKAPRGDAPAFNIPEAWLLAGDLDLAALAEAFERLVQRHESLRTAFIERDGIVVQRMCRDAHISVPLVDLSKLAPDEQAREVARLREAEARACFAFDRPPLLRARLLRLAEGRHLLLMTLHHLIADGWSVGVLRRELGRAYDDVRTLRPRMEADPPARSTDHRRRDGPLSTRREKDGRDYFRRVFAGLERAELHPDYPRPVDGRRGSTGWRSIDLGRPISDALAALAASASTTPFVVCAALVMVLMRRQTDSSDIAIGFANARRDDPHTHSLVACLARIRPLRLEIDPGDSVADVLGALHEAVAAAIRHSDLPLAAAAAELKAALQDLRSPLFDVVVSLQGEELTELPEGVPRRFADKLTIEKLPDICAASPYDLALDFIASENGLRLRAQFDTALFSGKRIERLLRQAEVLARQFCERPDNGVGRMELLGREETALIRAWGEGPPAVAAQASVLGRIVSRGDAAPNAVALSGAGGRMTWGELLGRARAIARRLVREHGLRRGEIVLIATDWTIWCAPAILGVWMAGGAYFGWDPQRSARSSLEQVRAAGCRLAFCMRRDDAPPGLVGIVAQEIAPADSALEGCRFAPPAGDELAYVVSTTGSTGEAKLVMAEHRNLACWVFDQARLLGVTPQDCVLQAMSLLFDPAIFFLSLGLGAGARVAWCDGTSARDPEALRAFVSDEGVTIMGANSGQLAAFGPPPDAVRALVGGGEAISTAQVARIAAGRRFVNQYGPSEAACVTAHLVDGAAGGDSPLPIGRPLPGVAVVLLDGQLQPVPAGAPGTLWVAGEGVSRGYLNRSADTAEAFRPHPDLPGVRMYRTGDRARFLEHGALEFLGRSDRQRKVRGYRVDLGAIAALLERTPGIGRAVAMIEGEKGAEKILAVVESASPVSAVPLNRALASRLPQYMLPGRYVAAAAFPLLGNGKVDVDALRALAAAAPIVADRDARVDGEDALQLAFARVLGGEVEADTDFFEAGGDSQKALQLAALLQQQHGDRPTLSALFSLRTPRALAALLAEPPAGAPLPAIARGPDAATHPATFAQTRIWIADQSAQSSALTSCMRIWLDGDLDVEALDRALQSLAGRHEALRTRLIVTDGELRQAILPQVRVPLRRVAAAGAEAADAIARDEAETSLDLAAAPAMRAVLVELGPCAHQLVLSFHHAHTDGASAAILVGDLQAAYLALAEGREPTPAEASAAPRDYAFWEREVLGGPLGERLAEYWRERLKSAPRASGLPGRAGAPSERDWRGSVASARLAAPLAGQIKRLAARSKATTFTIVLAALATLARRYGDGDGLMIGFPASLRQDAALSRTVGCFLNPLPMTVRAELALSFSELLGRVRDACVGALENRHYPFDRMVAEAGLAAPRQSPLFRLGLTWAEGAANAFEPVGGRLAWSAPEELLVVAKSDFWLHGAETDAGIALDVEYRTAVYEEAQVRAYLRELELILGLAAADPQRSLAEVFAHLPAAPSAQRRSQYRWKTTP